MLLWQASLALQWRMFFFSSRRRHTRSLRDWSSDVCSSDLLDVGNQRELSCALDRGGELALVPRAHPRQPARQNLAALGQEAAQGAVVLVVEHADPGLAHGTRLGGPSHASSSSSSSSSVAITGAAGSGLAGRPSDATTRNRSTPSSSFTARSYSGSRSAAVSNCATT